MKLALKSMILLVFALGPAAAMASSHPVSNGHSHAAGTHSHVPRPHTSSAPKPHFG